MKTKQKGFTLIELVVVIVLLGIIGAVATARFQNLAGEAREAAQQGIAAEIQSSAAINYAASALNTGAGVVTVDDGEACTDVVDDLLTGDIDTTRWTVGGGNIAGCTAAGVSTTTCTLVDNPVTLGVVTLSLICTA